MKEKIDQFFELPFPARLGIMGGVLLVLGLGYYFIICRDTVTAMDESAQAIDAANAEIREKSAIVRNLSRFTEEVKKLDVELGKALRELPDKKEIDSLLAKVSDKARDAGLDIRLFQPRAEQRKDFYAEVPVDIEVVGSYHQVATFFDEVGHLERVVNLDQFRLFEPKVTDDEQMSLRTAVIATSFRFLDESERPKADEKGEGKKKRRKKSSADKEA